MNLLDIRIDEINKIQALSKITEFLNSPKQRTVFTPNPEMLVKAQKDEYFKTVLNSGDLNLCDDMGVQLFTGIKRIPGVDFMLEVCKLAAEQGKGVYLLGSGNEDVVRNACENLHAQFPDLPISGYNKGPVLSEVSASDDSIITDEINRTGAQILFVAFGMGKQEKWIYENLAKMPDVKIAMGVGGSFDFISGHIKRAPLFLRSLGLEWVYRLAQQPRRIGRIFNATAVFVLKVVLHKIYAKNS